MQDLPHSPHEDDDIAEKIRTGEYYQEARSMYDLAVHDPMAERYLYVLITVLAILSSIVAFVAVQGLYPLKTPVPFIVNTTNITEDVPHIRTLIGHEGETPSEAMLRFYAENYTTMREEYDIEKLDRNASGIKSQSSDQVFADFQRSLDPRNPDSPITLYQRYSTREITVLRVTQHKGESHLEVIYEAAVETKGNVKKSHWQADISFNYSGIELDEKGTVKPVSFIVTQYRTKRLQD